MYDNVKDFIVTTDTDTSKNLSSNVFNYVSPSLNVSAGSYTSRSFTVPLSTSTRIYQILVEAQGIWTGWRTFPMRDVIFNQGSPTQYAIAVNMSSSADSVVINFWYINYAATTRNFTAFNVNVIRNDFVDSI